MKTIDVLFTPAEFSGLSERNLSQTICVVFDILRATSTIVTALANGAQAVVPVVEISEALAWRERQPEVLLAGERKGVCIRSERPGETDFDLGNSPREFTRPIIAGKTIVTTTTNGTSALRACATAHKVWVGSFLNLLATASQLGQSSANEVIVICSGTGEESAFEDVLGAGALCDLLVKGDGGVSPSDAAQVAQAVYLLHAADLMGAMLNSTNAQRLLSLPELRDDVSFCLQRDVHNFAVELDKDGFIRRIN